MHYRLYLLGMDGRIVRGMDLDCRDDDHAMTIAADHDHDQGLELWQGGKQLMQLPAKISRPPVKVAAARTPVHFLARCHAAYANGIGDIDG